MSDIVERLRHDAEKARRNWPEVFCVSEDLAEEAADEIEKLREALSEMVTAFYDAGCHICGGDCASANPPVGGCPVGVIRRARVALGEKE
jgi:hypothetical protein